MYVDTQVFTLRFYAFFLPFKRVQEVKIFNEASHIYKVIFIVIFIILELDLNEDIVK